MTIFVLLLPKFIRLIAIAGVAGFLFSGSILTTPPDKPVDAAQPGLVEPSQWRHLVVYATLMYTLSCATKDSERDWRIQAVVVGSVVTLYGATVRSTDRGS